MREEGRMVAEPLAASAADRSSLPPLYADAASLTAAALTAAACLGDAGYLSAATVTNCGVPRLEFAYSLRRCTKATPMR